jgi:hypothetical protein
MTNLNAVIYYASEVFISLGLNTGTVALLATGVTGVVFFVCTIPAMIINTLFLRKIGWMAD